MRLVLACSALFIILLEPSQPNRLVVVTYTTLSLYALYSMLILLLARSESPLIPSVRHWAHWADVAWYLGLIALSSGTSSIFFFFFFFAILVASFRFGFGPGFQVTVVSAVLFTIIGYLTAPRGPAFELDRFLLRPVYLLVLGYMMAYWGGSETALKRRLALLKELGTLSNPRFGVDHTIGSLMEHLRAFYSADACLLVTVGIATDEYRLRRVVEHTSEGRIGDAPIPQELGSQLLALPAALAAVYAGESRWRARTHYAAYDVTTGNHTAAGRDASAVIAETLDGGSFITVPMSHHTEQSGRLYLTRQRAFHAADLGFLMQVVTHVMPIIENIRLVDRLTSDAAEEAQKRIARDLHDSVIQPYIGLQMGLAACRQKLAPDNTATRDIERLVELTRESIADLRGYVHGLREGGARVGSLLAALQRYTARFTDATGITVEVISTADLHITEQLATQVFQMAVEGLSNVRRHTDARQAAIKLMQDAGHLSVRIENANTNGAAPVSFRPRSISERAATLGGHAAVEQYNGTTCVVVDIPL